METTLEQREGGIERRKISKRLPVQLLGSSGEAAADFQPKIQKVKHRKRSVLLMITDTAREEQILSTDYCLPACRLRAKA